MSYYKDLILESFRERNRPFEECSADVIRFPAGKEMWPVHAVFTGECGSSGFCMLICSETMKFLPGELPAALITCNKLNAAGRWARWSIGAERQLELRIDADLREETAAEEFSRQVSSMDISFRLGLPELKAAKRGRHGRTEAEYAAAFECAAEEAAPPAREASLYADELEQYLKTTGYLAEREDERTVKIRRGRLILGKVGFRGNGDVRLTCSVLYNVSEEKKARALLACSRMNAEGGKVLYMTGAGEIRMRSDMFLQRETPGEQCVRELRIMQHLCAGDRKRIRSILR